MTQLHLFGTAAYVDPQLSVDSSFDDRIIDKYVRHPVAYIHPANFSKPQVKVGGMVCTMSKHRHAAFQKSLKCCVCGIEGMFFVAEQIPNEQTQPSAPTKVPEYCSNLYAVSATGEPVLMTVDHTLPSSLWGNEDPKNMATMCITCNNKKGVMLSKEDMVYIRNNVRSISKSWMPRDIVLLHAELVHVLYTQCNIKSKNLKTIEIALGTLRKQMSPTKPLAIDDHETLLSVCLNKHIPNVDTILYDIISKDKSWLWRCKRKLKGAIKKYKFGG